MDAFELIYDGRERRRGGAFRRHFYVSGYTDTVVVLSLSLFFFLVNDSLITLEEPLASSHDDLIIFNLRTAVLCEPKADAHHIADKLPPFTLSSQEETLSSSIFEEK